ncbi:DUF4397 domain-containing protein [Pontibacter sp. HSC-14F20]|uniref:DUF4397 domain-containing protein n=1 Tax=Pontibacter sp. HSC-14F20 TaxID=2864136 RepID=UPI001C73C42D|nr:DUF4397 domain-containing protein [Pontibacter sp. HSC-14F20]MBX0333531.1 DUF4397 domain-containing protein [Pontibacter sp. HSC-14F20]
MKKWMKIMMLAMLPVLVLTSCDDDDDDMAVIESANVMVVHASPDAPGVDLLVDNNKVNTAALTFPNNTGYLEVPAGRRNVKVNAAGTSTTVINANLDLERNMNYSVFAINTLSNIEPLVLMDDLTAPASGNAHVRFVHLSPDAPAVDIAVTDGPVLFSNSSFKQASAFTPVPAGSYNLEVRLAGTETVVLALPNVQVSGGRIYTVFARGFVAPPASNTNSLGAEIIINR